MYNGRYQFAKSFGYVDDPEIRRKELDFYAHYAHSYIQKKSVVSVNGEERVLDAYKDLPDVEDAQDVYLSVNYMPENFQSRKSNCGFNRGVNLRLDFLDDFGDDLLESCFGVYKDLVTRKMLPGVNLMVLTGSGLEFFMNYDHEVVDVCELKKSRYHKLIALSWAEKAIRYLKEHHPMERIEVTVSTGERSDMCCLPGYRDSKSGKCATLIFTSSYGQKKIKEHCEDNKIPMDAGYEKLDDMIKAKKKAVEDLDQSRKLPWDSDEAVKERERRKKDREKREKKEKAKAEREKARQEKAAQNPPAASVAVVKEEPVHSVKEEPVLEKRETRIVVPKMPAVCETEPVDTEDTPAEEEKIENINDLFLINEEDEARRRKQEEEEAKKWQIRMPNPDGINAASQGCAVTRIKQLEYLMKKRGGRDGSGRHHALFLYWRNLQLLYETGCAIEKLGQFNQSLGEPVTKTELDRIIYSDRPYTHKPVFFEKFMDLTEDEIAETGLYRRKERMAKIEANKKQKEQDKETAKSLFLSGVPIAIIAERLNRKWDTVQRWLKGMGVYHTVQEPTTHKEGKRKAKGLHNEQKEGVLCQLPQKSEQKNSPRSEWIGGNKNDGKNDEIGGHEGCIGHKNAIKHEVWCKNGMPKAYDSSYRDETIFDAGSDLASVYAALSDDGAEKDSVYAAFTDRGPKNRAFVKNGVFSADRKNASADIPEAKTDNLMATEILDFLKRRQETENMAAHATDLWQEEDHRLLAMDSGG